jgi:hypothetical protein
MCCPPRECGAHRRRPPALSWSRRSASRLSGGKTARSSSIRSCSDSATGLCNTSSRRRYPRRLADRNRAARRMRGRSVDRGGSDTSRVESADCRRVSCRREAVTDQMQVQRQWQVQRPLRRRRPRRLPAVPPGRCRARTGGSSRTAASSQQDPSRRQSACFGERRPQGRRHHVAPKGAPRLSARARIRRPPRRPSVRPVVLGRRVACRVLETEGRRRRRRDGMAGGHLMVVANAAQRQKMGAGETAAAASRGKAPRRPSDAVGIQSLGSCCMEAKP